MIIAQHLYRRGKERFALLPSQGEFSSHGSGDKKPVSRIKREDLKPVCYEYIYA